MSVFACKLRIPAMVALAYIVILAVSCVAGNKGSGLGINDESRDKGANKPVADVVSPTSVATTQTAGRDAVSVNHTENKPTVNQGITPDLLYKTFACYFGVSKGTDLFKWLVMLIANRKRSK